jgi:hypothetical protein
MTDYAKVLSHKYKGSEWTLVDNDPSTLVWLSESAKPSKEDLDLAAAVIENEMLEKQLQAQAKRQALLDKLGITEDEAKLLLGGN